MTSRPHLSVCWIIKNESTFLACSMFSVRGLADELVVGDTGSTDESVEIAQGFGARVFSVPWTGSFAEARNAVIERASGSWILFLDGDEALERSHRELVRGLIASPDAEAYYLDRRHYCRQANLDALLPLSDPFPPIDVGAIGYFPTHDVRLFRASPTYRYQGALHETIEASLWDGGVSIRRSAAVIHHFGPCKPPEEEKQKLTLYVGLARDKYERSPDDWKALLEYGLELGRSGRQREALALLQTGAERFPDQWELQLEFGAVLLESSDFVEAATVLQRVVEARPHLARAWNALGVCFLRSENFATASVCFEQCQALVPDEAMSLFNWGVALLLQGDVTGADSRFERCRQCFPGLTAAVIGGRVCDVLLGRVTLEESGITPQEVDPLGGIRLWSVLTGGGG